ncbi:hypothetical protein BH09VER1_BH09VER1_27010 [soil metagenome]
MVQTTKRKMIFKTAESPQVLAFYDLETDSREFHNLSTERSAEIAELIQSEVLPFFSSTQETLPPPWREASPYPTWDGRNPWFETCTESQVSSEKSKASI